MPVQIDTTLLQMAVIGYEAERQKIEEKIAVIQRQLNGRGRGPSADAPGAEATTKHRRRRMSAVAKKRIAEAQKKRWAAYRKAKKAA